MDIYWNNKNSRLGIPFECQGYWYFIQIENEYFSFDGIYQIRTFRESDYRIIKRIKMLEIVSQATFISLSGYLRNRRDTSRRNAHQTAWEFYISQMDLLTIPSETILKNKVQAIFTEFEDLCNSCMLHKDIQAQKFLISEDAVG